MKNNHTAAADPAVRQEMPLLDRINALAGRLLRLNEKAEGISGKLPETVLFLLWTVLHFVISAFHERWFDEAVAWQIAKNTPWKDLLLVTPHYEGHPQLWHLLLAVFAKNGAPYQMTLTVISYVFMGTAVFLLLFRTPLPRIMRWMLPFSYFILYEYGVIARPYCILVMCFVLLGILHGERNTRPLPYILTLMLLCASQAYGIVLAGSICAVWSIEIILEKKKAGTLPSLLKDRRVLLLGLLLVLAVVLILFIMPREDTYAISALYANSGFIIRFLYTFFILPLDSIITNIFFFDTQLMVMKFDPLTFCLGMVIGLLFLLLLLRIGIDRRTQWYLIVPHCIFSVFTAIVYFAQHHIGVWFIFLVFWFMISFSPAEQRSDETEDSRQYSSVKNILRSAAVCLTSFTLVFITVQGAVACFREFGTVFAIGQKEAEFIMDNGLDRYHIMTQWVIQYDDVYDTKEEKESTDSDILIKKRNVLNIMPESLYNSDTLIAYTGHNIFYHYHNGTDDHAYYSHKMLRPAESDALLAQIGQLPVPDVLLGSNNLHEIHTQYLYPTWGEESFADIEYVRVFTDKTERVWKAATSKTEYVSIYVRKEIAEELGLTIIPNSDLPV